MSLNELYINRFLDEMQSIQNYVEYTENNFYNQYKNIKWAIETDTIKSLIDEFTLHTNNDYESKRNQEVIKNIHIQIDEAIVEKQEFLDNHPKIEMPNEEYKILEENYGLVEYLNPIYNDDSFEAHIQYLRNLKPAELKEEIDSTPKSVLYYSEFKEDDYEKLIEYAIAYYYNGYIDGIEYDYNNLVDLQTLYRIFDYENTINIYRQSFILMTTAFDAAIFDIAKQIFSDKFFECMGKLNYDKNFKIKDIVTYGDFDKFKIETIDAALKSKYISDILTFLHEYDKDIFIVDNSDIYEDVMEVISRRNIHIHKRGIVDQQYFAKGNGGRKYGYSIGEYASIDSIYYNNTYKLLSKLILNLNI